jgi:hypothetical protein
MESDLTAIFGGEVVSLSAIERDEVRMTSVTIRTSAGLRDRLLLYDELHRLVAARLGWDALPSPPDRFARAAGAYQVDGRGSGHRVGLCLADERRSGEP